MLAIATLRAPFFPAALVQAAPDSSGPAPVEAAVDWIELIGRLHPALVHVPIGLVVAAGLIELFGFGQLPRRFVIVRRALLVVAAISAGVTATSGWFLARPGGYNADILFWHRWLSVSLAAMLILAALADLFSRRAVWRRLALLLAMGLVVVTGHQGGSLTHGASYLTRDVPEWMQRAVEFISPQSYGAGASDEDPDAAQGELPGPSSSGAAAADAAVVFAMLEQRCFRCHGPKKSKARLRLDQPDGLLSVVSAGAAPDSEIFRRVSYPEGHGDEMPPDGPSVEESELASLRRWINAGAPVDTMSTPDDVAQEPAPDDAVVEPDTAPESDTEGE